MLGLSTSLELRLALYGFVLSAIGGWMAYERFHLIDEGEARAQAKLVASSNALLAKAQKDIADQAAQHAADVAANEVKADAQLKAYSAISGALDERVRQFDAYRRQHPPLASAPGGPSPASPGECGAQSCGNLALQLAEHGDDLARSNGELAAALQSAQRDRDSLTGLPR